MNSSPLIRVRWIFTACSFFGFCFNSAFKVVISITIVAMVRDELTESSDLVNNNTLNGCIPINRTDLTDGKFNWSPETQNMIQEALFYGYIATQIPAGRLAEKFGAKHVFGSSILVASVASCLVPIAAYRSVTAFFAVRLIQGLAAGLMYPSMHSFLPRWIPVNERSLCGSIIYLGASIGTAVTLSFASFLSATDFLGGWPSAYYLIGAAGIVCYVCWLLLVYETPDVHPFITESEREEITRGCSPSSHLNHNVPLPLKAIFTSRPFYALLTAHFCYLWGFLTILTQLPTYVHTVLGINIRENGGFSSLPYICQAVCGWSMGYICDRMRTSRCLSITSLRKLFTFIGLIGPALCFTIITYVSDSTWVIALFTIALGTSGGTQTGFILVHADMAPTFSGTLMGLTNSVGNLPGILAPLAVGKMVHHPNQVEEWRKVFFMAASVCSLGAFVFTVLASAELQPWDPSYSKQAFHDIHTSRRNSNKVETVHNRMDGTPDV